MKTSRIQALRRMLSVGVALGLLALSGCVAYPYGGYGPYYGGGYYGAPSYPYAYGYAGPSVVVGGVWGGGGCCYGGWHGRYWR